MIPGDEQFNEVMKAITLAKEEEREACAKIVRELRFAYPGAATPDQLILLARQEFEVAILKRGEVTIPTDRDRTRPPSYEKTLPPSYEPEMSIHPKAVAWKRDAACIVCQCGLSNLLDKGNQPSGGLEFTTPGHYGSSEFDPMDDTRLAINVCDSCVAAARGRGDVLFIDRDYCYQRWTD